MKLVGSKQKACICGWLLAALAIAGVNGYGFIALESKPLQASSATIVSLRQKFARLESRLAENAARAFDGIGISGASFPLSADSRVKVASPEKSPAASLPDKVQLPNLSGIMRVDAPTGRMHHLAVLDGRVYREKDQVMAFVVEKISAEGVSLVRQGSRWFIESPRPRYSSDQGK